MGLQILVYLDGQAEKRSRRDTANAAAVIVDALRKIETSGPDRDGTGIGISLRDAWPEFFQSEEDLAFPTVGADMSDFEWETPTPESYERDMKLMGALEDNERISVREEPGEPAIVSVSGTDLEWT